MKEPVDHVERPVLPWRPEDRRTECGKPIGQFPPERILTRDAVIARGREIGKTRTYMTVCVTCLQTAERHEPWDLNPAAVVARWAQASTWRWDEEDVSLLNRELRAIAALVAEHREEFDAYVRGLEETGDLSAARAAKNIRRA